MNYVTIADKMEQNIEPWCNGKCSSHTFEVSKSSASCLTEMLQANVNYKQKF